MAGKFLQCRVDDELRERAEKCAAECDMAVGTWLREVVVGACDAHEGVELVESETHPGEYYEVRRAAGTCTCLGFEHSGHCKHLDGEQPSGDVPVLDPLELAVLSEPVTPPPAVEHPGEKAQREAAAVPPPVPRECPHLPSMWRANGVCRCGTRVGARMRR